MSESSAQLWQLLKTFTNIGLFTIGGGYAMIPLIEKNIVDDKHWATREELLDLIAVAQSCPGIFAVNISIFIGNKVQGTKGALASALGACLPSFVIILALAILFQQFRDNVYVQRFFLGLRPAVAALIAVPVFRLAKSAKLNKYNIWIPVVVALLIWLMGLNPVYAILAAGIGGYAYGQYLR